MAIGDEDYNFLRDLLVGEVGVGLGDGERPFVEKRLGALVKVTSFDDIDSVLAGLRDGSGGAALRQEVVEAILEEETYFYRGRGTFDYLIENVLSGLTSTGEPQIWCAACSSGQEPYSLSILGAVSGNSLADANLRILATDVSASLIEKAEGAVYTQQEVSRGLPARVLLQNFDRQGRHWRVQEQHRKVVEFRQFNLASSWDALPKFDVILFRNVLRYFQKSMRDSAFEKIKSRLTDSGVLLLGSQDPAPTQEQGFCSIGVDDVPGFRLV